MESCVESCGGWVDDTEALHCLAAPGLLFHREEVSGLSWSTVCQGSRLFQEADMGLDDKARLLWHWILLNSNGNYCGTEHSHPKCLITSPKGESSSHAAGNKSPKTSDLWLSGRSSWWEYHYSSQGTVRVNIKLGTGDLSVRRMLVLSQRNNCSQIGKAVTSQKGDRAIRHIKESIFEKVSPISQAYSDRISFQWMLGLANNLDLQGD